MKNVEHQSGFGCRYLFSASALLLICASVSWAASPDVADPPTLVLNDTNEPPYTTLAGEGFLDIIAGEMFRRAGLRLKLIKLPAERALMNANNGIEDGDLTRIAGLEKEYPNLVRVPEKLLDWTFISFTRDVKLVDASWTALEPLSVGHIKGWKIYEKNLRPATQVSVAHDPNQLFGMLDKNRIDVALYERWMGYALAKQMQIANVRVVEPPLSVREMFVYVHQKHADKIPALVAALRALKAEGMYTKVCREKLAPLAMPASQCDVK